MLDQKEKGANLYTGIADEAMRNLNWYFRLKPSQFASVANDVYENLAVLQEVLRVNEKYNPEFCKKYQEEFDNYRMAFQSLHPEGNE